MSRRRQFGSLCSMVLLVNLGRVVFAPLVEPPTVDFAVAPAELGVVATLARVGSAVSSVPTGSPLTRVSRHAVVLGAGAVLTAAALFTAFAPSVRALVADAFLVIAALGALVALYTLYAARKSELPEAGTADRHLLRAVRAQWSIVVTGVVGAVGFVRNGLFNFFVPISFPFPPALR